MVCACVPVIQLVSRSVCRSVCGSLSLSFSLAVCLLCVCVCARARACLVCARAVRAWARAPGSMGVRLLSVAHHDPQREMASLLVH